MKKHQLAELFNSVGCACVHALNRYHAIKQEYIEGQTVLEGARSVIIVDQRVLDPPPDPGFAIDPIAYEIGRMLGHALSDDIGEPFDITQRYEVVSGEINKELTPLIMNHGRPAGLWRSVDYTKIDIPKHTVFLPTFLPPTEPLSDTTEERNESKEILDCIKANGPITAEGIAQETEWNRHLVDVAIGLMIEHGLVYQAGVTGEYKDPMYRVTCSEISPDQYRKEYQGDWR